MKKSVMRGIALGCAWVFALQSTMPVLAQEKNISEKKVVENVAEEKELFKTTSEEIVYGWQGIIEEGNRHYLDENGEKLIGFQEVEEKTYLFDGDGIVQTGWQEVEGVTYYFSEETGERYENGIYVIDDISYVFDENGLFEEYKGKNEEEESIETPESEESEEGDMTKDEEPLTESELEDIKEDKVVQVFKGWHYDKGWYYYNTNGNKLYGWQKIDGKWYYLDGNNAEKPGVMLADCSYVINGRTYFFEGGGVMLTGWVRRPEGWYHTDANGAMQTGWIKLGKYWYYLDPKNADYPGLMAVNGKKEINGYTYFFTGGGEMQTGWIRYPEGWYYAHSGGNQQIGWFQLGKNWYYLDGKNTEHPGLMLANCELTLGKYQYAFKSDGVMRTGWWFKPGEGYHFYDIAGYMRTGWIQTGGKWYYMDPKNNNIMLSNQWFRNGKYWYYLKTSGEMAKGWLSLYGNKYYLSTDGVMRTGWQNIGGSKYYFYKENDKNSKGWGVMAKNTTIDGVPIGSDGRASMAYVFAENILNRVGWNLHAAFNWSASLPYRNYSNDPSPGSEAMAMYGFQNGVGDCYVMAATFYYMAKQLGYDAHQMAGYVPLLGGGMGVHSWVEIDMNGTTYVFDPNFTNQTGRNGYQIYYGMSGTWRYSNYYRMN